ncbi:MAG: glycine cleavage system protein H [candidate division KSB1 bacterium]|nr:glycine cleavage system protein H [candidate division KSB1 bacterium]
MVALFVVFTILVCLAVDAALQRRKQRLVPVDVARVQVPKIRLARGVLHAPNHLWLRLFPDGRTRIGLDDFAQKLLGRIDAIESVGPGRRVRRGEPILWIHQGGRKLALRSPVSGSVLQVNEAIREKPEILRQNPYLQGWLLDLEPEDLGAVLPELAVAEKAARWLRREWERLREFLVQVSLARPQVGLTMADGGLPVEGVMASLDDETWSECQTRFFSLREIS